ncbi:venom metalloproteinase antarease-like TtrivMP_A [Ixodes scapularis]|uniref:venom metalloproteinase antarease-like TtrivMP_A n=1 Tax=Ixodes scapularis TaxID=6945 RepID=UPI001A9F0987|nr:venom metalloproteinase antarease-like TtrivMP_A [Ixodes scapularis]
MMRYIFLCALSALIQNATARDESGNFEVAFPKLLESRGLSSEKVIHIKEGLTLNLEKCSILSENLLLTDLSGKEPVVTPMNGKYMERNLYHDKEKMAAVVVKEENGAVEVSGVISDTLRILPLHLMGRAEDGSIAHKIFQVDAPAHRAHDYLETSNIQLEERFNGHNLSSPRQVRVQVPDPFLVEILVVVDKYFYVNFDTDEQLVTYMATAMATVNIRYSNARNPKVQLLIVNITKDPGTDFLRNISVSDPSNPDHPFKFYTSPVETLPQFAKKYRNATCDAAMLVTGLELANQNGADVNADVKGVAYLYGLCQELFRFGIVADVPHTYFMVSPAAHELGHILGMPHDGQIPPYHVPKVTWKRCSATSGYLMAPSLGGRNDGFFSHCSLQHMRVFVKRQTAKCYEVKSKTAVQAPGQLPGVGLSMTGLCKRLHPHAPEIRGFSNSTLFQKCKFLCSTTINYDRYLFTHRLVDGMPCGGRKICFRDKCGKYSTDLPPLPTLPTPETTAPTTTTSIQTILVTMRMITAQIRTGFLGEALSVSRPLPCKQHDVLKKLETWLFCVFLDNKAKLFTKSMLTYSIKWQKPLKRQEHLCLQLETYIYIINKVLLAIGTKNKTQADPDERYVCSTLYSAVLIMIPTVIQHIYY